MGKINKVSPPDLANVKICITKGGKKIETGFSPLNLINEKSI